jgi:hypothetical protein
MKVFDPSLFTGGWFVGDFQPSIWNTKDFEVGYKYHQAGEPWPAHYHEHMDEITVLVDGVMRIQDQILVGPTIFLLKKGEIADPEFLADCQVVVIKTPSVPGDKIEVKKES